MNIDDVQRTNHDIVAEQKAETDLAKTGHVKKKFLGVPLAALMIMSIGLVIAAVVITYVYVYNPNSANFVKILNVTSPENATTHENQTISVMTLISGDIGNTTLNCETDNSCNVGTGQITLLNTDPINSHICNVTTLENGNTPTNVNVTYTSNVVNNIITISSNMTATFSITYTSTTPGLYSMSTLINCPTGQ